MLGHLRNRGQDCLNLPLFFFFFFLLFLGERGGNEEQTALLFLLLSSFFVLQASKGKTVSCDGFAEHLTRCSLEWSKKMIPNKKLSAQNSLPFF